MGLEPLQETGPVGNVDLTVASKLDRRVPDPARIVIAPIAIDHEGEQRPERRDIGDRLATLVRPLNVGADEPAERAELIEHGAAAHPGVETSTDPVARKGQHDAVTVPFMNLAHNADTGHELIVENDVELTIATPRRTSRTAPVAERCHPLAHMRWEGIDDRRVPTQWTLGIASPRIGRDVEKGEVGTGMGDRRDDIPNHVLRTRQHLNDRKGTVEVGSHA